MYAVKRTFHLNNCGFKIASRNKLQKVFLYYGIRVLERLNSIWLNNFFKVSIDPSENYSPINVNLADCRYYFGYWQDLRIAQVGKDAVSSFFGSSDSVKSAKPTLGVHCRRGDFTSPKNVDHYAVTTISYFNSAISRIREYHAQFDVNVFTDDTSWAVNNLPFATKNNTFSRTSSTGELLDFKQLSACDHFVISNSTYSWWVSFLGNHPNKLICIPEPWLKTIKIRDTALFDEEKHLVIPVDVKIDR